MEKIKNLLSNNDKYFDSGDVKGLKENIDAILNLVDEIDNSFNKTQLYYSIATGLGNIYNLTINELSEKEKEINLEKQIFYFRMAIDCMYNEKSQGRNQSEDYLVDELTDAVLQKSNINQNKRQLYASLFVNLGSCYDTAYRPIDAIYFYKRALKYIPSFPMATGNKGIALQFYSKFFFSHFRHYLNKLAYVSLKDSLLHKDYLLKNNPSTVESFEKHLIEIRNDYLNKVDWLESKKICDGSYGNDEDEEKYKIWVAEKGLFLNPLNDASSCIYSINDVLHLPAMMYHIDEDQYKHFGLFNQIKQEFVSTRYLFYCSSEGVTDAHYSDRGNIIINTLDYSNESYYDFLQKACFKSLHSILDRIAFFINDYFDLSFPEKQVSFRRIWKEKADKTNKLKDLMEDNFALKGLYWLAKDIHQENYKTTAPKIFDYKDFRDYLEHKYVKTIKATFIADDKRKDTLAFYITESELLTANLELLRLVRAIIITLISAIDVNELKKSMEAEKQMKIIPSIGLEPVEDEWKL